MDARGCLHGDRTTVVDRHTGALVCARCGAVMVEARGRPDLSWSVGCPLCGAVELVSCTGLMSHRERWAEYHRQMDR